MNNSSIAPTFFYKPRNLNCLRPRLDNPVTPSSNILSFTTDRQRFDSIGTLGNSQVVTPPIDRWDGLALTRASCQSPICTPSRLSVLTGTYLSTIEPNRNRNEAFETSVPPMWTCILSNNGTNANGMTTRARNNTAGPAQTQFRFQESETAQHRQQ